jgi:hypothetical protein
VADRLPLRALIGCEMSGRVRDAFARRGWEVWSADILPSESPDWETVGGGTARHYQGDVRDLFKWRHPVNRVRERQALFRSTGELPLWDFFAGFPPCDHLSLAGARYWAEKRMERYDPATRLILPSLQDEAAGFFMDMIRAPAAHVAVENPRGDMTRRYRAPDQYVEPWWFGDPLKKKIGLWLNDLPQLTADIPVEPTGRVATGGGSHRTDIAAGRGKQNGNEDGEGRKKRKIVRSRTSTQVARAMADQWGPYLEDLYRDR